MNMTKRYRGKLKGFAFLFPLIMILALSCAQDSIFSGIAAEEEPKDPRIAGTPTNIIELNGAIYAASVGSGTIHKYTAGTGWATFHCNGGSVTGIAADGTNLYVLAYSGSNRMNSVVWKYDGTDWVSIGGVGGYSLQTIYGAGDKIFVGGNSGSQYGIFYYDDGSTPQLELVKDGTSLLSGAAFDGSDYFIATSGSGVYKVDTSMAPQPSDPVDIDGNAGAARVTGIMNVNGFITAVTRYGQILAYDDVSEFKEISSGGPNFTGGMSIWQENTGTDDTPAWEPKLLLLGIQSSSSYTKGYREVSLDAASTPPGKPIGGAIIPGTNTAEPSSISPDNKKKYDASLARYSVFHILQVPGESTIFASTANNGLHSLRGGLWNAEE
jgi:hypothetical protein